MANKRYTPEEIVPKLRQVEVLIGRGMARVDAIRELRLMAQADIVLPSFDEAQAAVENPTP